MIRKHLKIFGSSEDDIVFRFKESWVVFHLARNGKLQGIVIAISNGEFRSAYFFFNSVSQRPLYTTRMTFAILAFVITNHAENPLTIFFKAIKTMMVLHDQENDQRRTNSDSEPQHIDRRKYFFVF